MNLPSSGTIYAKPIKKCFEAPPGWLMVGADFSSLEDRISALTTKDPNKLTVYTDGMDGHAFRAAYYFPSKMPDITKQLELHPSDRVFKITENGSTFYVKGTAIIDPNNSNLTVEETYDTNKKL